MARVGILLALAAAGSLAIGTLAFVWVDSTLADNYDSLHELARLASECKVGAWTVSELRKEFRAIAHGAHPDTAIPGSAAHCSAEAVGEALTKLKRMHPDTAISFPFALAPLIGSPEEYAPRQCATYILAFLSGLFLPSPLASFSYFGSAVKDLRLTKLWMRSIRRRRRRPGSPSLVQRAPSVAAAAATPPFFV